jgi:hypothetical protein
MEVTKWLKPSISVSRNGGSASVEGRNASERRASLEREDVWADDRERLKWLGELSEDYASLLHRGIGGGMYTRKGDDIREKQVLNALYPIMGLDRMATQAIFEIIKNQPGY